jgi:membrane protein required for colicin V production
MSIIDIIVFVLVIIGIIKGWRNGLVLGIFSVLAFIIGLAAAVKLSAVVAERLQEGTNISQRWLPVLAFAIVFLVVVFLVRLGAKALEGVLKLAMLGWLNKLGGVLLYVLLYLFIFSILLFYAQQLNIVKPETAEISITYPIIYPMGQEVIGAIGTVLPFFKDMFAELESFFDGLSRKV